MNPVWRIRLAEQAELDLLGITVWTLENFGDQQAQKYAETLSLAIEALGVVLKLWGLSLARIWVRVFVYCMWRAKEEKADIFWCSEQRPSKRWTFSDYYMTTWI